MKQCSKIQCSLILIVAVGAGMLSLALAPPLAAAAEPKRAPIDVLLLGYYVWAKPEYVELCRKEGIHIHGTMRKDPTGADPANYPVDFLKKFHVIVASGPLEKPWDPQVVGGTIKPGIVENLLEYNRQGGGVVWTPVPPNNPVTLVA